MGMVMRKPQAASHRQFRIVCHAIQDLLYQWEGRLMNWVAGVPRHPATVRNRIGNAWFRFRLWRHQ